MKTGTLIGLGVVLGLLIWGVVWAVGLSNREIELRNTFDAQQKNCMSNFDTMWKIIKDEANVADQYKEGFREIYVGMMDARYGKDSNAGKETLMKWIQESNPTFDPSLYSKLMNTIEGVRQGFADEQKKLLDINREHRNLCSKFPNSMILSGRPEFDVKLVTSAQTKEAYNTGEDNRDLLEKK